MSAGLPFRKAVPASPAPTLVEHIEQNIESIVALQKRDEETVGITQRWVERVGRLLGRPLYLIILLSIVLSWVVVNLLITHHWQWDPAPFSLLDGIVSLISLITTTIVLIAQNRQTKREQQHSHLGLQVSLLTEQKVSKLIDLIEELRRDLPMVKDRVDPSAEALGESADTAKVADALAVAVGIPTS